MNIAFTQAADGLPRRAFTVANLRRMIEAGVIGEEERIELVEGEVVVMAAKGYAHEIIKKALNIALNRSLANGLDMSVEMTLQFSDNMILEPDLVVFRENTLVRTNENFCQIRAGGLLLAIEVAASSLAYDKGAKARLYSRLGIREFWVIDANERVTWVHTGPSGDGWASIVERGPGDLLTTPSLPGFSIRLADI